MKLFKKIKAYFESDSPLRSRKSRTRSDADLVEKYEIGAVLGTGSFAVVKIVIRKSDNVQLACKIIDRVKFKKSDNLFKSEIAVLQKLIKTTNNYYLISDLAAGGELFTKLLNRGHFYEKDAARITKQLLLALEYLHGEGIVHRDLKPENIVLKTMDEDSDIMLTDFGLARFSDKNDLLTTTCGTPYYVAPEILSQTGYSFPCDLWSIGVITYVLLSGRLPFQSDEDDVSNFILFSSIKKGKFNFSDESWSDISNDAKDFIAALLNVDPEKRPTAAVALEHKWLTTQSRVDVLPNVRKNFSGKKTFKKAVTAVRATLGKSQSHM